MTAKRFTYDYEDDKYYDKGFFKDNGKELYKDELLELLNRYDEECKMYRKDALRAEKDKEELLEEKEQLINKLDDKLYFKECDVFDLKQENKRLKRGNEQLKQELKVYRKVANCGNCQYHNYDWFDDGDEFEVCDKGNDVTDGICEDWEEIE